MTRKISLLFAGALVLGAAACGSSNNAAPVTTTTAAASASSGTSTTTAAAGTSTTTAKSGSTTTVTKPVKVEKIDTSKLPKQAQSKPDGFNLTADENDCIDYVVYNAYLNTPGLGTDDATVAGVAGGAIAACVTPAKIADSVIADLKAGTGTWSKLSNTQYGCLKDEIVAADQESLAIFVAALAYGQDSMLKPFEAALSQACNIRA